MTWSTLNYSNATAIGNVLADYVDAGGGVVVAAVANTSAIVACRPGGRWITGGYEIIPGASGILIGTATLGAVAYVVEDAVFTGDTLFVAGCGRNVVVEAGRLERFLLDTYAARKLKLEPTGSAGGGGGVPHATTSNFTMQPGSLAPEQLLEGIERGLFVTSMMGFGFDAVTGDFSRGAAGFLIEEGKLTRPVGEITISRNLDELLQGIDAIASDLELRSSIAAPSFRVDRMTVSGR